MDDSEAVDAQAIECSGLGVRGFHLWRQLCELYSGARKNWNVTGILRHIMNFGDSKFTAHILNDDSTVQGMKELLPIAARYV